MKYNVQTPVQIKETENEIARDKGNKPSNHVNKLPYSSRTL